MSPLFKYLSGNGRYEPVSLYLVSCCDPGQTRPVKVGIASDARGRLAQLSTASPYKLELVDFWILPGRDFAAQAEKLVHHRYASRRLNGEWFDLEPWYLHQEIENLLTLSMVPHTTWETIASLFPLGELWRVDKWRSAFGLVA